MLNEIAPRTRPNRDDADQVPGGRDIQAPFADEVLRLRRTRPFSEPIVSFHALPWGQGRSLAGAGPIGEKYRQLFGEAFLDTEMTHSAGVLDSYFQPSAGLDLAQHLAAEAFRADYTFFIVFGALAGTGERILVDRTAHQSIHMPAGQSSASVDYAPAAAGLPPAGQPLSDIVQLLEMVAAAADVGTPYDTIVLAACSYDGVLYNLHRIMSECLALSSATAFLVDEAWSAINTVHLGLRPLTALDATHRIVASGTPITVRVTQFSAQLDECGPARLLPPRRRRARPDRRGGVHPLRAPPNLAEHPHPGLAGPGPRARAVPRAATPAAQPRPRRRRAAGRQRRSCPVGLSDAARAGSRRHQP